MCFLTKGKEVWRHTEQGPYSPRYPLQTHPMEESLRRWSQILPAFYGTRRFITVVITPHHCSLSWPRLILHTFPPSLRSMWYHPLVYASVFPVFSFLQAVWPKCIRSSKYPQPCVLPDFISLRIFETGYKLWRSSLPSFPQARVRSRLYYRSEHHQSGLFL
jgi:hypothetical protein